MEFKRPARGETDEELLKMQEEFLRNREIPSAQVQRPSKRHHQQNVLSSTKSDDKTKKSKFKESRQSTIKPKSLKPDNHSTDFPVILTDIVEHETTSVVAVAPKMSNSAFPKAVHVNTLSLPKKPKKSIFALQMEKLQSSSSRSDSKVDRSKPFKINHSTFVTSNTTHTVQEEDMICETASTTLFVEEEEDMQEDEPNKNTTDEGRTEISKEERQKIHEENLQKLKSMSKEEIMSHREQLLKHLDPKIVEFMKSKKHTIGNKSADTEIQSERSAPQVFKDVREEIIDTEQNISLASQNAQDQQADAVDMDETELPIPLSEAKKWPNMNIVEKEKLAWMTALPKPKTPDPKVSYIGRFDFEGNLLSRDADVPTQMGLHHHGDEPEVAGYTMEELFSIVRSSVQSQRIIALQTLTNIFKKHWNGIFDKCFDEPLLPQLLDSGIVPLLRFALDDSSETALAAAVKALHALIISIPDEACLDRIFNWHKGYVSPFLKPPQAPEGENVDKETELKELTDVQVVNLDVVKGLLRMDLLPRLRYILEICRPDPVAVGCVLEILVRVSRHSLEAATKVLECPGLLKVIVTEFLPSNWGPVAVLKGKMAEVYQAPLYSAVKLVRTLSSAGRHLATRLVGDFPIKISLCCYLAIDPGDGKLPSQDYLHLAMESLKAWKVFLSYGLLSDIFIDLFPIIFKQLQFCQTLSISVWREKRSFDEEYAASLISCLCAAIHVAASHTALANQPGDHDVPPPLTWQHVSGLVGIVEIFFFKWISEIVNEDTSMHSLNLIASTMDFLANYYLRASEQSSAVPVLINEKLEQLCSRGLVPLIKSKLYNSALKLMLNCSSLTYCKELGSKRDASSLMSLSSLMWYNDDVTPVLKEGSPFPFLASLTFLVKICTQLHRSINEAPELLLTNSYVTAYLNHVLNSTTLQTLHWFSSFEIECLYNLVCIAVAQPLGDLTSLYHCVSLLLLTMYTNGKECCIENLMNCVIFHPAYFREHEDLACIMNDMKLVETFSLKSATDCTISSTQSQLLSSSFRNLSNIKASYLSSVTTFPGSKSSRWRYEEETHLVTSVAGYLSDKTLLQGDWMYFPIFQLYDEFKKNPSDESTENKLQTAISCLQWIHMLAVWRTSLMDKIPAVVHYCRLATVFLMSNDLFLDNTFQQHLIVLFRLLFKVYPTDKLDLNYRNYPNLPGFLEFFSELLQHYIGVSYGDALFGNFVLVPLQQCYDIHYRKMLFIEHSEAFRTLRMPLKEITIPIENFLSPLEKDEELLSTYCKHLLTEGIHPKRTPLFYVITVHHLCNFIFGLDPTMFQVKILKQLKKQQQKMCVQHVFHYKGFCVDSELGFLLHETIPNERLSRLESV